MRRLIRRLSWVAAVAVLALALPAAAVAQRLGSGGSPDIPVGRIVAAFLLCVAAAVFAIFYLRRGTAIRRPPGFGTFLGAMPGKRRLETISSVRASQHADLSLVRCDDREYLLLISAHSQILLRVTDTASDRPDAAA